MCCSTCTSQRWTSQPFPSCRSSSCPASLLLENHTFHACCSGNAIFLTLLRNVALDALLCVKSRLLCLAPESRDFRLQPTAHPLINLLFQTAVMGGAAEGPPSTRCQTGHQRLRKTQLLTSPHDAACNPSAGGGGDVLAVVLMQKLSQSLKHSHSCTTPLCCCLC